MTDLTVLILLLTIGFGGCSNKPVPIAYGKDICDECEMMISDARFGAERVTSTGKVFMYDSIECLLASLKAGKKANEAGSTFWVTAFENPNDLVEAKNPGYVIDESIKSPMGGNIAAFIDTAAARRILPNKTALILGWDQLRGTAAK